MTFLAVRQALLAKPKKIRGWIFLAGLGITILLSALYIYKPPFFRFLDYKIYDTHLRGGSTSSKGSVSGNTVIVDIDEKSLLQFGQWPWPRYRLGQLLKKIQDLGASSVGLDMFFPEADRTSLIMVQQDIARDFGIRFDLHGIPENLTNNDTALATTLSKGPYVLGYNFVFSNEKTGPVNCSLHPVQTVVRDKSGKADIQAGLFRAKAAICSLDILARAVPSSGFFNVTPDPDGVLRRAPLLIEYEGRLYPSLALATVLKARGISRLVLGADSRGLEAIGINGTSIPVDAKSNLLIRFYGKGKPFTYISALDIMKDRIPRESLRGKIVFLGTSAAGLEKYQTTPLVTTLPGAEIHATIVNNILNKEFNSQPDWIPGLELLLLIFCGIVSAFLLSWTRALLSFCIIVLCSAGMWIASGWTLQTYGVFASPLFPMMAFGANFSFLTFVKYWREERTVKSRNRELVVMQNFTIQCLAALTETRDSETGRHIERCQHYVKNLCNHLAANPKYSAVLDDETIDLLYRSASLHDIGKVGVPDRILLKPSALTEEEYMEMKKHTVYGREAIQRAEKLYGKDVKDSFLQFGKVIAYTHHEKWNGTGYPEGLKGADIPLFGRIMAIADVYDAIICKRRYKPSFSHEDAVEIIARNKGTHFDPDLVEAFLEVQGEFRNIAAQFPDD